MQRNFIAFRNRSKHSGSCVWSGVHLKLIPKTLRVKQKFTYTVFLAFVVAPYVEHAILIKAFEQAGGWKGLRVCLNGVIVKQGDPRRWETASGIYAASADAALLGCVSRPVVCIIRLTSSGLGKELQGWGGWRCGRGLGRVVFCQWLMGVCAASQQQKRCD